MTEPRIAPIDPPYEPAIDEAFTRVMPPGMPPLKLFRTMANSPRVLQRMFAGSLLDKGSLSLRERELVILRTCARCGAEYEWGVHVALFAGRVQLDAGEIAASRNHQQPPAMAAREAVLFQAVDALHDTATIDDAVWAVLARHYSTEQILEIIALTGYYHTISFIANAAGVALEDFAPRFDGQPPQG